MGGKPWQIKSVLGWVLFFHQYLVCFKKRSCPDAMPTVKTGGLKCGKSLCCAPIHFKSSAHWKDIAVSQMRTNDKARTVWHHKQPIWKCSEYTYCLQVSALKAKSSIFCFAWCDIQEVSPTLVNLSTEKLHRTIKLLHTAFDNKC